MLVALAVAAWAIPAWELATLGTVSVVSVVSASMLTAMLLAWPFLNGRRLHHGHAEKALMCRDCKALRWPNELSFGFCIHCGSARPAVQMAY